MRNAKFVILFLFGVALLLFASSCAAPEPEIIAKPVTVVMPKRETVVVKETVVFQQPAPAQPPEEGVIDVPFEAMWASSGHADAEAEAFIHWDEDDPPVVSASCAKCHSTGGMLDFLGLDGTAAGTVDNDAPIGTVVSCIACHNDATLVLDRVTFPSGVELASLGDDARCMLCHQGRASKATVDGEIEEAGVTDVDLVSEDLGFTNIHYFAAAATKAGSTVLGGYQYDGKTYDVALTHVEGYTACMDCHNPHTLELKLQECSICHEDVASTDDLKNVRLQGSEVDYDGDGRFGEGIYYEIEGLREMLYQGMQAYSSEVAGAALAYTTESYPYFFNDGNANGVVDEDEAIRDNAYASWTARLAKAAYNYQVSLKDPGAYAHNGKYIIELLYDSIEDLNGALSAPTALEGMHRIDAGHFAGSEEAFRHWDEDGEVSGSCAKCHSATGLPFFLKEGVNASQPLANGFQCTTCHDALPEFTRYAVEEVQFPSGMTVSAGDADNNLCLNCHQGRESTTSVNARIGDTEDDTVSPALGFLNIHYFAAGATVFGTEAKGAYEYEGKPYRGRMVMESTPIVCLQCHSTHSLEVKVDSCGVCHVGVVDKEDLLIIRNTTEDYDGDGDVMEGIAGEISTLYDVLYTELQDYAREVVGTPIVYDGHSYPYFFVDTNGNGEPDEGEANYGNRYATWTPRLVRAAFNYQYVTKDPGAYTHNGRYIIQVLYDTLEDLGVDVSSLIRPAVEV